MQFCQPAVGRASSCFDSFHLLQEQKRALAKVGTVAQGRIPGGPTAEGLVAWPWGTDDSCWLSQVEAAAAQVHLKKEALFCITIIIIINNNSSNNDELGTCV